MAIDPYAPCPCGSGKKLKFCCSDIADEIEKIYRKIQGDQTQAALKQVEALLERHPDRATLIDLKATLELSLKKIDQARETIVRFMLSHPDNALSQAQSAILEAATGHGYKGIVPLQNALEMLDETMPQRVLEAIGAVGHALLLDGEVFAARGHLLLYNAISPEKDNAALEMLVRLNLESGLPLLLRQDYALLDPPAGVEWRGEYEEAVRLTSRGHWRKAAEKLEGLLTSSGPEPVIVFGLALLKGWLGEPEAMADGLHRFASLEVPEQDAVEAEALAQLVDSRIEESMLDVVRRSYAIADVDSLGEKFAADERVEDYPLPEQPEEDSAMRPRSTHVLLDRAVPKTGVGLQRDAVPNVAAFLSVFGKRTDREARVDVTTDSGELLAQADELLHAVVGDGLGEVAEEEKVGEKSGAEKALSWRWRLPDDTPAADRRRLLTERRREALLVDWPKAPQGVLGGKSPEEARGDDGLKMALTALVFLLEQASSDPEELSVFNELRQSLGLAELEPIRPGEGGVDAIPLSRLMWIDAGSFSIDDLATLLQDAYIGGAAVGALVVAREIIARSDSLGDMDISPAFRQAIRLEQDSETADEYARKAIQWCEKRGKSAGEWRVARLEIAIRSGQVERLEECLQELREKHANEPEIAEATLRLLHAAGLLREPVGGAPAAAAPPASGDEKPGIWTPNQQQSPEGGEQRKSGLWVPG